jgi:hypothetical protein
LNTASVTILSIVSLGNLASSAFSLAEKSSRLSRKTGLYFAFSPEKSPALILPAYLAASKEYELTCCLLFIPPSPATTSTIVTSPGSSGAERMLANTYHIRHSQIDKKEIEKNKLFIKELNDYRKSAIQSITQTYEKVIKENQIIAEILQEICFSPFMQDFCR